MKSYRVGILPFLAMGLVLISTLAARAQVFSLTDDMTSSTPGADGAFTYGTKTAPDATTMTPFDSELIIGNFDIFYNSASTDFLPDISGMAQTGEIELVPGDGPNGLDSVVRFTAPATGLYDLWAMFSDASGNSTADIHVVLNGTSLYDNNINLDGGGSSDKYNSAPLSLAAGDVLDFVVGNGDGVSGQDTIALEATISEIPEPRADALLGGGVLLFVAAGRFRRLSGLRA